MDQHAANHKGMAPSNPAPAAIWNGVFRRNFVASANGNLMQVNSTCSGRTARLPKSRLLKSG